LTVLVGLTNPACARGALALANSAAVTATIIEPNRIAPSRSVPAPLARIELYTENIR
jgi:hypothetical protein